MSQSKKRQRGYYEGSLHKGWYKMYRGWQDHPLFTDEPFTKRETWEWLISSAVYKENGFLIAVPGGEFRLMRGQLSYSYAFMANAWGWAKSKVERWLKKLQKQGMIELSNETGQTIITICNYSIYQDLNDNVETVNETQSRRKQGTSENNKKKDNKDQKRKTTAAAQELCSSLLAPEGVELNPFPNNVLLNLERKFGEAALKSWISNLCIGSDNVIYAPNKFQADWCKNHYFQDIELTFENEKIKIMHIEALAK